MNLDTCTLNEIRAEYDRVSHTAYFGDPGYGEMSKRLAVIVAKGISRFGKPTVPNCYDCQKYSVFGGPSHFPSNYCESGKRPHCTCDACF